MKRGRLALAFLPLCVATVALPALAQQHGASPTTTSPSDAQKAQVHFNKAKELYFAGSYSEAITELEIARKLDPQGRDLVMNLAICHEKLGKYDEALIHLRSLLTMSGLTAPEKQRAENMIKRIESVKQKQPTPAPSPPPSATQAPPPTTATTSAPPPPPPEPKSGRVDGLTITFGVGAGVGLLTGAALGVYAMSSRPTNYVTGRDGSFSDFKQANEDAHSMALFADVALGVGLACGVVAAALYFGRTKEQAPTTTGLMLLPSGVGGRF